jgi:hypothetical protein
MSPNELNHVSDSDSVGMEMSEKGILNNYFKEAQIIQETQRNNLEI